MESYHFDLAAAAQHAGLPALPPSDEPSPRSGARGATPAVAAGGEGGGTNAAPKKKEQGGAALTPAPTSPAGPPPGAGVRDNKANSVHTGFDLASAIAAASAASPFTGANRGEGTASAAEGVLTAGAYTESSDVASDVSDAEGDAERRAEKKALRKKKAKKKRDKDKPKRARSAYTFFVAENRSRIVAQHPEFSFYEIGRALGVAWKTTENKGHYQRLAAADKKRAKRERSVWEATRPKRAISAYAFFVKHNRKRITEEHPGADFAQIGKLLGVAWKECGERQKFEEMAARDKIRCELARSQGEGGAPYSIDHV